MFEIGLTEKTEGCLHLKIHPDGFIQNTQDTKVSTSVLGFIGSFNIIEGQFENVRAKIEVSAL